MPIILELTSNNQNYSCSHHERNSDYNCHYSSVCGADRGHIGNVALDTGHISHQHVVLYICDD